jgi:cellulose biosynthesis protein BcsQ
VRATEDSGRVAAIDMDEAQGTLTEFWVQRGRPVNPYLYDDEGTLDEVVKVLRGDRWDYLFIDGPPHDQDAIEMCVYVSDVVLLPVKLSYADVSSIDSVIAMCRRRSKPYAFVINEFDDRRQWTNSNNLGLRLLNGRGRIMQQRISSSPKHRFGLIEGRTGAELDTRGRHKGPIAKEIDALWAETLQIAREEGRG